MEGILWHACFAEMVPGIYIHMLQIRENQLFMLQRVGAMQTVAVP